jgi:hypothetical protein
MHFEKVLFLRGLEPEQEHQEEKGARALLIERNVPSLQVGTKRGLGWRPYSSEPWESTAGTSSGIPQSSI